MDFGEFCNKERRQKQVAPAQIKKRPVKQMVQPQRRPAIASHDILAESEEMIGLLQEKIQQVFYRFGMAGLERLDEAIVETCQQMLYPDGNVPTRKATKQAARPVAARRTAPQPKKPMSVLDVAGAALTQMEEQDQRSAPRGVNAQQAKDTNVVAMDESGRAFNPLTDMAPLAESDVMSQFEGEQLNPEEMAIIQQGLSNEGMV